MRIVRARHGTDTRGRPTRPAVEFRPGWLRPRN